jgi:hypothetical protein
MEETEAWQCRHTSVSSIGHLRMKANLSKGVQHIIMAFIYSGPVDK